MLLARIWTLSALALLYASAATRNGEVWTHTGFAELSKGRFADAGRNVYVSRRGRIQLINRTDLNGDGHADVSIANGHGKTEKEDVFVYLNGGSDFNALERLDLPANGAHAAAIADLDQDGFNDLVLAQRDNGITSRLNAYIYWGGADGFTPRRRAELPAFAAVDVAIGDFNGDGWADLAFACRNESGAGTVPTVYWNSASGFDPVRRQDLPGGWERTIAADWDRDGIVDLVASTSRTVLLFRGGRRGLSEPLPLAKGGQVIAVGDWSGDGKPDLVVAESTGLNFYAQGAGEQPTFKVEVGNASGLAWSDFDADGRMDLLVGISDRSGNEFTDSFVLWNDPAGFTRRERARLPTVGARGVAAADLNGDGFPDAVIANHQAYNENEIQSFVYWNSKGSFDPDRKTMLDTRGATGVAVGDIDRDRRPDLVFVNSNGKWQEGWSPNFVYWGDGGRGFSVDRRTEIPGYYTTGSVQADLNDDGWVDLGFNEGGHASGRPGTLDGVYLWWGSPDGFSVARRSILSVRHPTGGLRAADLDRNGWLDLIVGAYERDASGDGGLVIYWGRAEGYSVQHRQVLSTGSPSREPLVADLNGDGYLDLAAAPTDVNGLFIFWGHPDGYDSERRTVLGGDRQFAHAEAADLNGDGHLDLIAPTRKIGDRTEGDSFVYYGSAEGFSESRRVGLPTMAGYDPSVADLNRDGWLDIVFPNYSATRLGRRTLPVYIYWGSANGFDPSRRQELPANAGAGSMIVDFDGDGWLDLFVACHREDGSSDEAGKPHTHHTESFIYWNGPGGFQPSARTALPSVGAHAQVSTDVGNVATRELAEYYISPAWVPSDERRRVRRISWEADTPHGTAVRLQLRTADSEKGLEDARWSGPAGPDTWFESPGALVPRDMVNGPWVQYRARLSTPNGGPTPYLTAVIVATE